MKELQPVVSECVEDIAELQTEKVDKTRTINNHGLDANVIITKEDVGLGAVDNTSDINKPISNATRAALNAKADVTALENETARATSEEARIEALFTAPTQEAVNTWLDEHPEATTTVQDNSLTFTKLVNGTLGFITPEMFGAVGDGVTDDTTAFERMIESSLPKVILLTKHYLIGSTLKFPEETIIDGNGKIINDSDNIIYIALLGNSSICNISFDGVGVDLCGTNVKADNLYIENVKHRGINVRATITLEAKNIKVSNVRVVNPVSHGFTIQNNVNIEQVSRANAIIDNIVFENCAFINNYDSLVSAEWQVGFGILCTGSSVKDVTFRDCFATGASESGFHIEYAVSCKNVIFDNCQSIYNGQKDGATYGAGFLIPNPSNANANYHKCFTKGNKRAVDALQNFGTYRTLDIVDVDTGYSVKDMVTKGNGSVLMNGNMIKAYSARYYTNANVNAFYRPHYFMHPAHCYTFADGVYAMTEAYSDEKTGIWTSPLFPINPEKQIKVSATVKQNIAVDNSIRMYLIFFDGQMNNLGNVYKTITGMSDNTDYSFSNTFENPYSEAAYALLEINPDNATNTSLTTIKNILATEV